MCSKECKLIWRKTSPFAIIAELLSSISAHVAELVDAHGSGPCAARCGGSSPSVGTIYRISCTEKPQTFTSLRLFSFPRPCLPMGSFPRAYLGDSTTTAADARGCVKTHSHVNEMLPEALVYYRMYSGGRDETFC